MAVSSFNHTSFRSLFKMCRIAVQTEKRFFPGNRLFFYIYFLADASLKYILIKQLFAELSLF